MAELATPTRDAAWTQVADGVTLNEAAWTEQARRLLPEDALALLAALHRALDPVRQDLLAARRERYAAYDDGALPDYLDPEEHPEAHGDWQVAPLPDDLLTRRVEITGPINDPKMVINMLSRTDDGHRADAAMLDFEDSCKPSWGNILQGLDNLIGAADGTLTHEKTDAEGNVVKRYALDPDDMPLLMVRVRGLHLDESNVRVDGEPVSGALFDFAMSMFHTAQTLIDQGKTPKFYVPKVEHYLEARWFNDLFVRVQEALSIPQKTAKATFLIETLPAAFQMEEILYEYRDHAAGLNGGRWDKIFSDIKVLKEHGDRIMADRNTIGISNRDWMINYAKQLIRVCHRHGAFGMGGMAPQTPGKTEAKRQEQIAGVVADKEFESRIGHDGCWVSHPYFIAPAMKPFDEKLEEKGTTHQLDVIPELPERPDLLPKACDPKTLDGIRVNVRVSIGYMKGWLQDMGAVGWDYRMEDLATFEISRAQTWQWLHHGVTLEDGQSVTPDLVSQVFDEELETIMDEARAFFADYPDAVREKHLQRFQHARDVAEAIYLEPEFRPFLACSSDPAHLSDDERRARLRAGTC
ncbi:MAG: malate synthase A [Bacteroidetes bacterium]|nr:malate synthase A [Bacteroidota bacterium]